MDNYTDSFGLQQYSNEIQAIAPLSREETANLGQRIFQAHQGLISDVEGNIARDRIIHGHLHLIFSLAQRYPYDLREDMIQEGSIGLIEAVERYHWREGCDFHSYAIVAIQHAFTNAMEFILPIRIPRSSMRAAQANGTTDRLYAMQPASLGQPVEIDTELCLLADTLAAPKPTETQEYTHTSPVDALLDTLPSMTRLVIELRYGLDEEDQRQHSYAQVADKLGISKSFASKLEHEGLMILNGHHQQPDQLRQMAQESRLNAAYTLLQQGQQRISGRKLAKVAKVRSDVATAYLQRVEQGHKNEQALVNPLGEKTYTRLLHAYRQLQEQNVPVTALALQKATGGNWNTAKKFLDYRAQLAAQGIELADMRREAVEA